MPIFEFKCDTCGNVFETLVFSNNQKPESCPKCGGCRTTKVLSVFARGGIDKRIAQSCSASHSHSHSGKG